MIFHYTTIQTLALILRSQTLRFNRLDRVDDVLESQTAAGIEFGPFFFVSCWTRNPAENIPLWSLYSKGMLGVRIGLPDFPFERVPLVAPPQWNMIHEGTILSPLRMEETVTDTYLIPPFFLTPEFFAGGVSYVDDVAGAYRKNVELRHNPQTGQAQLTIRNLASLMRTKSMSWKFQEEYRFCLMVLPGIPLPPDGLGNARFTEKLASHSFSCMIKRIFPPITHFDVRLDGSLLRNAEVTVGPLATDSDFEEVRAMTEKAGFLRPPKHSFLHGTIRSR